MGGVGNIMYAYAFVAYFDYKTEELLKNLWKDLSEKNITQYGVEVKGKRPHITIADYDNLSKNEFIALLDEFYSDKSSLAIELNTLGSFINTATLFIAPMLSSELFDFHRVHHSYFKMFNDNEKSFYIPGKWTPHCTIESRLNEENMIQAFSHCKSNLPKISGKISEVALIEVEMNDDGIAIEDRVIFSKKLI